MRQWLKHTLVALDQLANAALAPLLNAVFGIRGFGWPDETISSVLGKHYQVCKLCRLVCRLLALVDERHCQRAIERDEGVHS